MKQMPFEPPRDYYDEQIAEIDEQICYLIQQRKENSNNNPGFPAKNHISKWSEKYHLHESFLNAMFSDFLYEDLHKPIVEPKNFLKNIPVLKGFERGETLYSVSFVRQYENASVIHFSIEEIYNDEMNELMRPEFTHFELSIKTEEGEHECRNEGGGGSNGSTSYSFIVSPALPEDLSKYELVFKEYKMPFNKPTGFEFIL